MAGFETLAKTFSQDERLIIGFLIKQGGQRTTAEVRDHLAGMSHYLRNDSIVLAARGVLPSKNEKLYFPPAHETVKKILLNLKQKNVVNEKNETYKKGKNTSVMSWWNINPAFAEYWFKQRKKMFRELLKLEENKRKLAYPRHYLDFFELEDLLENK